jgi:hypothetical protein
MAINRETLQRFGHGHNIVVDQQVSHQMVIFDKFALLVADQKWPVPSTIPGVLENLGCVAP